MSSELRPTLAALLLLSALGAFTEALHRLRRHERAAADAPGRWFGYARDGVNLGAAAALTGVFVVAGYSGPAALLFGVSLGFAAYAVDFAGGRWRRVPSTRLLVLVASGGLGLLVLVAGEALRRTVDIAILTAAPR